MNKDDVKSARKFAVAAHGSQTYGTNNPYVYHLDKVAKVCLRYGGKIDDLVICYLHDVLEDTNVPAAQIENQFGNLITKIVMLLSNTESKKNTYERIRSSSKAVFIKLCDRIANVEEGGKVDMYKKQYPLFRSVLYRKGEYESMWRHLDGLLL